MQRVFLAGRSGQTCPLGGGTWLLRWLSVKISSSECVKSLQTRYKLKFVAQLGGFFLGGAERQPNGFLGGERFEIAYALAAHRFLFASGKAAALRATLVSGIQNHQGDFSI